MRHRRLLFIFMLIVLLVIACLMASFFFFPPSITPRVFAVSYDKCVMLDENGKWLTEPIYDWAGAFRDGIAPVSIDGSFLYIDRDGKTVLDCSSQHLYYLGENRFHESFFQEGGADLVDIDGKIIVPKGKFDWIGKFSDGFANFIKGEKSGFIDVNGKVVFSSDSGNTKYWRTNRFSEGMLCHYAGEKFESKYEDEITPMQVSDKTGKCVFRYNEHDSRFVPFEKCYEYSCGFLPFYQEDGCGYFDKTGKPAFPERYDYVAPFTEGLAVVCNDFGYWDCSEEESRNQKWMVIDTTGAVKFRVQDCAEMLMYSEGLVAFSQWISSDSGDREKKWGYINREGRKVIPAQFDRVSNFSEGKAWVKIYDRAAVINSKGELLTKMIFNPDIDVSGDRHPYYFVDDYLVNEPFVDGRSFAEVRSVALISTEQETPLMWLNMTDAGYSNGLIVGYIEGDSCGYSVFVNNKGKLEFPQKYNSVRPFSDGIARVRTVSDGPNQTYIDRSGKEITKLRFFAFRDFSEGLAAVGKKGDEYDYEGRPYEGPILWGYLNKRGEFQIPYSFDVARPFHEGVAYVEKDGKKFFVNSNGEVVINVEIEADDFCEGLARITVRTKPSGSEYEKTGWSFIDKLGNRITNQVFMDAGCFSEGLVAVKTFTDEKWGFIDKMGNVVIKPEFDKCYSFSSGIAAVKTGDKWGFCDKTGRVVLEPRFDEVSHFISGRCAVMIDDKWGFIDLKGNIIVPPVYDEIGKNANDGFGFDDEIAIVKKAKNWGVIGFNGEVVLPFRYSQILWGEKVK